MNAPAGTRTRTMQLHHWHPKPACLTSFTTGAKRGSQGGSGSLPPEAARGFRPAGQKISRRAARASNPSRVSRRPLGGGSGKSPDDPEPLPYLYDARHPVLPDQVDFCKWLGPINISHPTGRNDFRFIHSAPKKPYGQRRRFRHSANRSMMMRLKMIGIVNRPVVYFRYESRRPQEDTRPTTRPPQAR